MWELDNQESWALKNWCFWSVVLEKTLESPLDYKEIQPVHPKGDRSWKDWWLEGLMLKLKLQYFSHLMQKDDSFEKTLMLGKVEGRRRRGHQRKRWLDGLTNSMDMGLHGLQELVMDREVFHALVHGVTKSWTWLSDWTEVKETRHKRLHFVGFHSYEISRVGNLWRQSRFVVTRSCGEGRVCRTT